MLTKPSRPFAVVVDTNILIRAFLSGKLGEDRILQIVLHDRCDLIYSRRQLHEFTAVLGYHRIVNKYAVDQTLVRTLLQWVSDHGKEADAEPVDLCRDPSDNHIIGLALNAARNRTVYPSTRKPRGLPRGMNGSGQMAFGAGFRLRIEDAPQVAAGRSHLVTGDRDILVLRRKIEGVTVLTPGELLKRMSGR